MMYSRKFCFDMIIWTLIWLHELNNIILLEAQFDVIRGTYVKISNIQAFVLYYSPKAVTSEVVCNSVWES